MDGDIGVSPWLQPDMVATRTDDAESEYNVVSRESTQTMGRHQASMETDWQHSS